MGKVYEIELEDGRVMEIETDDSVQSTNTPIAPLVDKNQANIDLGEQRISNRQSMMKSLIQDPSTLQRLKEHPLGTPLRTMGGALELLEGVPASIAMDIRKGRPQDIIPNIGKVALGERPIQRGDVFRSMGMPETLSAGLGLATGINKFMPDAALSNAIGGGIAKLGNVAGIPKLVEKFGKPMLAKAMSIFSEVPTKSIEKAISNPNYLKPRWLKNELSAVKEEYKKIVQPFLDDTSKQVNLQGVSNIADDLGLVSKGGEWTKNFSSLKPTEARKILKWESAVQQGRMSFNKVDALIGEMDSSLKTLYKAKVSDKVIDYSDDFIRMTKEFRGKLNDLRKTQFPEAGKVLSRYEDVKAGESVYKNFDRWFPHFLPIVAAGALGVSGRGVYSPLLVGGAIPKFQGFGIRGASALINAGLKSGAVLPEAAFERFRNKE